MNFDADDQATLTAEDQLPLLFRILSRWIMFLFTAVFVTALGFATFGVVLAFRYLIGLNW